MKKKVLIWILAALLLLSMVGCAAGTANTTTDKYAGMEPAAAAESAAAETKDTTSLSDHPVLPDRQAGASAHVGQEQEEHAQDVSPVAAGQGARSQIR